MWKIHHLEIIFKGKTINFYSFFCVFTGGHVHPWKRRQPGWSSAVCSQRLWPPDREVRALDVGWLQLDGNLLFYLDKGYEITNIKSSYWDRQGIRLCILYGSCCEWGYMIHTPLMWWRIQRDMMQPDCDGPPGHLGCLVSLPFSASSTVESFNEGMTHLMVW